MKHLNIKREKNNKKIEEVNEKNLKNFESMIKLMHSWKKENIELI